MSFIDEITVLKLTYSEAANIDRTLASESWDNVVSLRVVEHLYAPRRFARTLHDLLEPGGTAIVSTPNHGYVKNVAPSAREIEDGDREKGVTGYDFLPDCIVLSARDRPARTTSVAVLTV